LLEIFLLLLLVISIGLGFFFYKKSLSQIYLLKQENFKLETTLDSERKYWQTQTDLSKNLQQTFQGLANEALLSNNKNFLDMVQNNFQQMQNLTQQEFKDKQEAWKQLMNPIQSALEKVDSKIQDLEKQRIHAYGDLQRQLIDLLGTQKELKKETASLVKALRSPNTRGQWGEMQLKRVIELAGMIEYCDFVQQPSVTKDDQKIMRPDVLVKLPSNKYIIIDAKTPLLSYLESLETDNMEVKQQKLLEHSKQVKDHIKKLSQKSYHEQFVNTPEFVVMFLPSESIFSAALDVDPTLIEIGVKEKVLLATPTTLIALLRSVAYGWKQESISKNAKAICSLGQELAKRLYDTMEHTDRLGKHLKQANETYQKLALNINERIPDTTTKLEKCGIDNFSENNLKIKDN
jgi:DNA recombination protein RmuC